MLKTLRSKTKIVMWAALILVIPSFVLFYGWNQIQNREVAGTDFVTFTAPDSSRFGIPGLKRKVKLDREAVRDAREELRGDLTFYLGPELVGGLLQEFGEDQIFTVQEQIRSAVNSWILRDYADRKGITVSTAEVRRAMARQLEGIRVAPGQTKAETYRMVLRNQGMTPESFERSVRQQLILNNAILEITDQAQVTLDELWRDYQKREQKIKVDYVAFKGEDYKSKIAVSDGDLSAYYQANQEKFRVGDQRQYRYAYFSKDRLTSDVVVSEKALGDYYETNKAKYARGPQVRVRQIFFPVTVDVKTTKEDVQKKTDAAFKKVQAAKALLDKKTDFATVANQMSEDPDNTSVDGKTKMGGLVSQWISETDSAEFGQDYVKAALALKPGETSGILPVKEGKYVGMVILKGEDARPQSTPPLDEVKPKVEADFRADQLQKKFQAERSSIETKMKEIPELDKLAKATGMKEGSTGWTLVTAPIIAAELGVVSRDNMDYIAELKPGERSALISSEDVLFILQVINQRPSYIPKFDEIRAKVEAAYVTDKAREMALSAAKEFAKNSPSLEAMEANAAADKLAVKTTDSFTRDKLPEDMPSPLRDFARDSFAAKVNTVHVSEIGLPKEQASGAVVWRLKEVTDPDQKGFVQKVPSLQREVLMLKQRALLNEWLSDQRKSMNIKINPEILRSEG